MDVERIRLSLIRAIASDEFLMDTLVLKGGNALALVHGIGHRTSLDLDYSLAEDVESEHELRARLDHVMRNCFTALGLVPIGMRFESRPRSGDPHWRFGGYRYEFMLTSRDAHEASPDDLDRLARSAILSGSNQRRKFRIEISRFEYCGWTEVREMDGATVRVYSPELIVAEKLRALCQQMPAYPHRPRKTPRPRDLYDIYACVVHAGVSIAGPDFVRVLDAVFEAKDVPVDLLSSLADFRDFHSTGWDSVQVAVSEKLDDYDFYFDFVLAEVGRLQALRNEKPPA